MSSSLTPEELEKKRAEIDSRPPEEPTGPGHPGGSFVGSNYLASL